MTYQSMHELSFIIETPFAHNNHFTDCNSQRKTFNKHRALLRNAE